MLEFLGFIALLAIIFGVSFGVALTGFIKFVVIAFAVLITLGVIATMLESKNGAFFVLIASICAIGLGVFMINDSSYEQEFSRCTKMSNELAYRTCASNATNTHSESTNKGWVYVIAGGITGVISYNSWSKLNEKEKKAKKH